MSKNKIKEPAVIILFFFFLLLVLSDAVLAAQLNILFITFDTTRADHVGCYGYKKIKTPNIDRLADEGCLFENAFTSVPLTFPAHTSMFTGMYPPSHGVRDNGTYALSEAVTTLAELLKKQGYKTAAFVSAYVLDKRFGLDQGFDFYDDDLVTNIEPKLRQKERRAWQVTESAIKWLEGVGEGAFFLWIHYFDPHDAYQPPPPFSAEYKNDLYDGEIAYADYWLGKLLYKFSKLGLMDNTLVVLAGDHGEGLGDHHEKTHGIFIYDNTLWVPLIFSRPGLLPKSRRISPLVRLIDITPTILNLLSLEIPEYMEGVTLLPLMLGEKKDIGLVLYCETVYPKSSHNWSPLEGLRTMNWKYIYAPIKELYRLDKDPHEKVNLYEKKTDQAAKMDESLIILKKEITPEKPASSRIPIDEESMEKLRSLGYVSAPSSEEKRSNYPDPKKMIEILEFIDMGAEYFAHSQYEKAKPLFEKVLEHNPEDIEAYVTLGHIYEALGEDEKSIESFEKALKLEPENLRIYIQLGVGYMKVGRYSDGIETFKRALDFNPRCKEAYFNIGLYHFQQQEWIKARDLFHKVLELDYGDTLAHNYLAVIYQRTGEYDKALSAAQNVLTKDPNNTMALLNMGLVYQATQRTDDALVFLNKAILLKPDFGKAYYFLGLVYFQQNRLQDAIEAFRQAIKYDSNSAESHFNLGFIYTEQKDFQQAIKEYKAAIDEKPDFVEAGQMLQRLQEIIKRGNGN